MKRALMICVVLMACGTENVQSQTETTAGDLTPCKATGMAELIGQPVNTLSGQLPERARIIQPDMAVTQDFRPDRANIEVDANGIVTAIRCG